MTREARYKRALRQLDEQKIWDILCRYFHHEDNFLEDFAYEMKDKYPTAFRRWAIQYIMEGVDLEDLEIDGWI